MRGIKVHGHSSLSRSSSCPGLLLSTDQESAEAASRARANQQEKDDIINSQQQQLERMQAQIDALLIATGVSLPEENEDV